MGTQDGHGHNGDIRVQGVYVCEMDDLFNAMYLYRVSKQYEQLYSV